MRKNCFPLISLLPHINKQTYSTASERFEEAKLKLKTITKEPSDDIKLKLYALFKQSTTGPCKTTKPSVLDFIGRAKWDAWNSLGSMNEGDAKQQYADLIQELLNTEQPKTMTDNKSDESEKNDINVIKEDNVTKIILNRPKKKNALTTQMYNDLTNILKTAANDDTVITVLTGNGDYYCSGNDLSNFSKIPEGGNIVSLAKSSKELLKNFVEAFINFPKPLIVAVNGPAVGISVTLLGLCDVVYAANNATFHTPFSQLAQSPEACSSLIFPKIMGYAKANEMLLFNKKLTAEEALDRDLISEIIPKENFATEIDARIKKMSKLPKESLICSKQLIRGNDREFLRKVNETECEVLCERWLSPDFPEVIMAFFQRKSAL